MTRRVRGAGPDVPRALASLTPDELVSLRDEIDRQRPSCRVWLADLRAEINQLLNEVR